MKFKQAFFVVFSLCWLPFAAQAAIVKQMYEVSLPVVDQDKAIRKAAFEQAFIETLVRVSGSGMAPTQVNLSQAARYVQKYRYLPLEQQPSADGTEQAEDTSTQPQPKYNLWVQFNPRAIKKLLRDNGLPIWGQQRPSVLIWLAVRDGPKRYVLKRQHKSPIKNAVEKEARRRGLPLRWPEYDKQDQQGLAFVDLWGGFWEPIKKVSSQYGVDAILLGRMNWRNGGWQVSWSMPLADQPIEEWQLRASDLNMLMASGIDMATDQIASRFSVLDNAANDGELIVQVDGIYQLSDYARTLSYLSQLAPVKQIFATQVDASQIRFHVDLTGDKEDLQRIIALGRTLSPAVSSQPLPATGANQLSYKLKP